MTSSCGIPREKLIDLQNRFSHHAPVDGDGKPRIYEANRTKCLNASIFFTANCPPGRELSLAITHLEEAMFWANAAIARSK